MGGTSSSSANTAPPPPITSPPPPPTIDLEDAPDPDAIGNAGWTILHTTAVAYPERPSSMQQKRLYDFINAWSHVYPCTHCATHMRLQLKKDPPQVASREDFALWTCRLHNEVNERLGKDEFPCDYTTLLQRWHPTYPNVDGGQPGGMQDLPPFVPPVTEAGAGATNPDLQSLMDMKCTAFCPKDEK